MQYQQWAFVASLQRCRNARLKLESRLTILHRMRIRSSTIVGGSNRKHLMPRADSDSVVAVSERSSLNRLPRTECQTERLMTCCTRSASA
jgi:hypothetical protein